jgi:K+-transporting ATPase ATPase A chain
VGNLEGKELRFGPSAGPTFAAVTTAVACGSMNCAHDSLNPLAGLPLFAGMWLNCVLGGKGPASSTCCCMCCSPSSSAA